MSRARPSVPAVLPLLVACAGIVACSGGGAPCGAGEPTIEVGQRDQWNVPDGTIAFGIPPQGGAPYAPFQMRVRGVEESSLYVVRMDAWDAEGNRIEERRSAQPFVCANAGVYAGYRFAPDVHMRFFGLTPPELDGDTIEFEVSVLIGADVIASDRWEGTLDWTLGPRPEGDDTAP